MRILLFDMDWLHGTSAAPNHQLQKVSSYHKQIGDIVNMLDNKDDAKNYDYDIMYLFREINITPFPDSYFINNKKVRMVGSDFDYYENYFKLNEVMVMVQPDYLIYDSIEQGASVNDTVIQMIYNKKLVSTYQDFTNRARSGLHRTIIYDDIFSLSDEDVLVYFDRIKHCERLVLTKPVSIKRIITNPVMKDRFLSLSFRQSSLVKLKNDYGHTFEDCEVIVNFIKEIKEKHPSMAKVKFPVKGVIYDHFADKENGIKDFKRIMEIVDYCKRERIEVKVKAIGNRLLTPYWPFFESVDFWTENDVYLSYIEFIAKSITRKKFHIPMEWHDVINNPQYWMYPRINQLISLMVNQPEVMLKYGIRRWGDRVLDVSLIDLNKLVKAKIHFEQENLLEKLQSIVEEI